LCVDMPARAQDRCDARAHNSLDAGTERERERARAHTRTHTHTHEADQMLVYGH